MKILVTGATGTVGGHVVRYLTGWEQEMRVLVRNLAKADFPAEVEVVRGDLHPVPRHRRVRRAGTAAHPGQDRAHPVTGSAVRFLFANNPLLEVS